MSKVRTSNIVDVRPQFIHHGGVIDKSPRNTVRSGEALGIFHATRSDASELDTDTVLMWDHPISSRGVVGGEACSIKRYLDISTVGHGCGLPVFYEKRS